MGRGTIPETRRAARAMGSGPPPSHGGRTPHLDEPDSPGEALGDSPNQMRRGAPEYEEPRWRSRPVCQDPQQLEKLRLALDFIDDHQPSESFQRQLGSRQPSEVDRVLEVEILGGSSCYVPGHCGFPDLPRAHQRDHGALAQGAADSLLETRSPDHDQIMILENRTFHVRFSRNIRSAAAPHLVCRR
jgi:hypothetical protein